jgi:prephenate dehydrogenase
MADSSSQVMSTASPRIDKLVIVGVGLIGGSFALAQKAAGVTGSIVGVGRGQMNLEEAANLGIIDRFIPVTGDWTGELATSDIVLLAAPVAQYPALLLAMAPHLGPHTIVTDAGSTKQDVIAAARATLGAALPRFVPAHPIAGTEQSGAAAAFATLFAERNVVLTPLPETDPLALATVAGAWQTCGARVRTLDAATHDRIFAAVSHLPHLLAFALVDELAARPEAEVLFRFAASGFRDFTRIAASSAEMWRDVSLANRDALIAEVAAFRAQLDRLATLLTAGDGPGLEALFASARTARRTWESRRNAAPGRVPEDTSREH